MEFSWFVLGGGSKGFFGVLLILVTRVVPLRKILVSTSGRRPFRAQQPAEAGPRSCAPANASCGESRPNGGVSDSLSDSLIQMAGPGLGKGVPASARRHSTYYAVWQTRVRPIEYNMMFEHFRFVVRANAGIVTLFRSPHIVGFTARGSKIYFLHLMFEHIAGMTTRHFADARIDLLCNRRTYSTVP